MYPTPQGNGAPAADLSGYATTAAVAAGYQPLDSDLTAIAALTTTSFGRALLTLVDAAAMRTAAGLGTLATQNGSVRERLAANRIYYVRPDGSDSNTGLVNSAGGAFLTIQFAINAAAELDTWIYDVTIQIADGTWTENLVLKTTIGSGRVIIKGNTSTPANVHLSVASGEGIYAESVLGRYRVQDLKLTSATFGMYGNGSPTYIEVQNVQFGVCGGGHMVSLSGAYINIIGSYAIVGASPLHIQASFGTVRLLSGITVTITGTPAFSNAWAVVNRGGLLTAFSITFSGSATGVRYLATSNGVVFTLGAATTYFPGNSVVAPTTGGQYT